ncbi:MAG: universal stress protein, partial [Terriglobales bacterium]
MRVIVAVDDKPSSQAIIDALIKMHWFEGTEISLISVLPPGSGLGAETKQSVKVLEELEKLSEELRKALRQCEVEYFAREGEPRHTILELADETAADLIVLGSNCKNTLERLILGSVSQAVVNHASCPVIVAKTPCCLAREVSPAFRNILVPIDNSNFSDAAIRWLANFSWEPNTQFIVAAITD